MEKGTKKILVVEDEKPLAKALQLKLEHEGFEVATAGNGEEALTQLEQGGFAMAICDLVMPKMDGFHLLEAMKEKKILLPVIILSNLSQAEDAQRAKELGASEFFIKSNTPIADVVAYVKHKIG